MKRTVKIIIVSVVMSFAIFSFTCLAAVYGSDFPSYCPYNGGAWSEISTSQGDCCIVFRRNCISDIFGFNGSTGSDILNVSNSTVSGKIYFKSATSYYGSPMELDCRFQSFGTLEVSVPYQSSYGTRYEWQPLSVSSIKNTNINFADSSGDRQNNAYIYTLSEKQNIIIICLLIGVILYFIFGRAWNA